jgi:hypothetical protein
MSTAFGLCTSPQAMWLIKIGLACEYEALSGACIFVLFAESSLAKSHAHARRSFGCHITPCAPIICTCMYKCILARSQIPQLYLPAS